MRFSLDKLDALGLTSARPALSKALEDVPPYVTHLGCRVSTLLQVTHHGMHVEHVTLRTEGDVPRGEAV